jgi:hypothetical protein
MDAAPGRRQERAFQVQPGEIIDVTPEEEPAEPAKDPFK